MIYDLNNNVIWDNELPLHKQGSEMQELAYMAMKEAPVKETNEPTTNGFYRALTQVYTINKYFLHVRYVYNEPSTSKEWAGLENIFYTLNATIDGK